MSWRRSRSSASDRRTRRLPAPPTTSLPRRPSTTRALPNFLFTRLSRVGSSVPDCAIANGPASRTNGEPVARMCLGGTVFFPEAGDNTKPSTNGGHFPADPSPGTVRQRRNCSDEITKVATDQRRRRLCRRTIAEVRSVDATRWFSRHNGRFMLGGSSSRKAVRAAIACARNLCRCWDGMGPDPASSVFGRACHTPNSSDRRGWQICALGGVGESASRRSLTGDGAAMKRAAWALGRRRAESAGDRRRRRTEPLTVRHCSCSSTAFSSAGLPRALSRSSPAGIAFSIGDAQFCGLRTWQRLASAAT